MKSKGKNQPSENKKLDCFIAMPFDKSYDDVYNNVYKKTLDELEINGIRADEFRTNGVIADEIYEAIKDAHFVLADISENNANVFYEIGLAHAMHKQVILVANGEEDVAFDVDHIRRIVFDSSGEDWKEKLKSELSYTIKNIVGPIGHNKRTTQLRRGQMNQSLMDLSKQISDLNKPGQLFELSIVNWRLIREAEKIAHISKGHLTIAAQDEKNYLRYVFGSIIKMLSPGDIYKTFSNIDFWGGENIGSNKFINSNFLALRNGAIIQRIILINLDTLSLNNKKGKTYKKDVEKVKKQQNALLKRIQKDNSISNEAYQVRYLEYRNDEEIDDIIVNAPFAIIYKPNFPRALSVVPRKVEKENGAIARELSLNFKRRKGSDLEEYLLDFDQRWDDLKDDDNLPGFDFNFN